MPPTTPYLHFDIANSPQSTDDHDIPEPRRKPWYMYLPLCGTIILILAPHPSLLFVLVNYHLQTLHQPAVFAIHLLVTYTLTFLAFSSLILCVARDPGPVVLDKSHNEDDEDVGLTEALMGPPDDFSAPGKWCGRCWVRHNRLLKVYNTTQPVFRLLNRKELIIVPRVVVVY